MLEDETRERIDKRAYIASRCGEIDASRSGTVTRPPHAKNQTALEIIRALLFLLHAFFLSFFLLHFSHFSPLENNGGEKRGKIRARNWSIETPVPE